MNLSYSINLQQFTKKPWQYYGISTAAELESELEMNVGIQRLSH